MKRVLPLYFWLVWGCSMLPSVEVVSDDPTLTFTTQHVLLHQGQPFTGYVVEQYADGTLKTSTGYREGLKEGAFMGYYPSGVLSFERYYAKGEKEGTHYGYYESGKPEYEYTFEKGLSEGKHLYWYESGQLAQEMNYVDGREFGSQKVWRKDGKLRSNYVVREDGRRYGLVGIKRCKNIDIEGERIAPLTVLTYEE